MKTQKQKKKFGYLYNNSLITILKKTQIPLFYPTNKKNMKHIFPFFFLFCTLLTFSQNETPKYIDVIGSSVLEVTPDQFFVKVIITEYWEEEYKNNSKAKHYKTKVELDSVEKELFKIVNDFEIKKENIITENIRSFNRAKKKETLISKTYKIKFNDFYIMDDFINELNFKGFDRIEFSEFTHSKITEFRKQVKIEALNQAKLKADYLLQSLGKERGDPLIIEEIDNDSFARANTFSSNSFNSKLDSSPTGFKPILIRFEIKARFEIK